jgi:capsular polysaccharide biosynthesis protein
VAGIVLGLSLAFVLEFFNVTIQDEKDIERFLQVPVLATVRQF